MIAGSLEGRTAAEKTYQHLATNYAALLRDAAEYYQGYLARTVNVGLVTNPYLGTGLVAGYRTSGESQRPGLAWF